MLNYTFAFLLLTFAHWIDCKWSRRQEITVSMLTVFKKLSSERVEKIMFGVDRYHYAPKGPLKYNNTPLKMGFGATISSPETHGLQLQALEAKLREGGIVLDVGSGSGYITACLALMVGETGYVVGIDHVPELAERAKKHIKKDSPILLEKNRTRFVVGDGRLGYKQYGPYDVIHIGAVVKEGEVPPELLNQLKNEGRLVMPVNRRGKKNGFELLVVDKDKEGKTNKTYEKEVVIKEKWEYLTDLNVQLKIKPNKNSSHHC